MKKSLKTVKILAAAAFTGTMLIGAHPVANAADVSTATELQTAILDGTTPVNITQDITFDNGGLGTLGGSSDTVEISGNNHSINGNSNPGLIVNSSQTLNINNVGSYTTTSTKPESGNYYEFTDTDGSTKYAVVTNSWNGFANTDTKNGAILNHGTLSVKNVVFYNNSAINDTVQSIGSVIMNTGTITNFTADCIGNYAKSTSGIAYGGAIYNKGTIGKTDDEGNLTGVINSNFYNNHVQSEKSEAQGGAIYNEGTLKNIEGDFTENYAKSTSSYADGGAIANYKGTIGNITGDFTENYATSTSGYADGGAIENYTGTIGNITGDFTENYATSTSGYADGGAIANDKGTIGNITGDFTENYATSTSDYADGGAIANYKGTIGNITGDFTENYAKSTSGYAYGGAIYNYTNATIGDITGNFSGNYTTGTATGTTLAAAGGAIANDKGTIGNITGDFTENYATSTSSNADGGAIANYKGTIGNITGDFTENYAKTTSKSYTAQGGAIYNFEGATIGNIKGNFTGNSVFTAGYKAGYYGSYGGAIYNSDNATIGDIAGNFIQNSSTTDEISAAGGGAIYNADSATIGNITGDFTGNYSKGIQASAAGGAISNVGSSQIGDIKGNFSGNYAEGKEIARGGAIENWGSSSIKSIIGNFSDNYAKAETSEARGGAIYNKAAIGDIKGNFSGNYAEGKEGAGGGAILNAGTIGDITGDFKNNYAKSEQGFARGGAILNYNSATIGNITGNFINNYAAGGSSGQSSGGAIYNYTSSTIGDIIGNFEGNYVTSSNAIGGAILNAGTIGDITGDFKNNYAISESNNGRGGAIWNLGTFGNLKGNFSGNSITSNGDYAYGGAIYNKGTLKNIEGDFSDNYAKSTAAAAQGGAIWNSSSIADVIGNFTNNYATGAEGAQGGAIWNSAETGTIRGSFLNNYAETSSANKLALGGAIYTSSDMTFAADENPVIFSGNYTKDYRGTLSNAIFVQTDSTSETTPVITFNISDNSYVLLNDSIDGGSVVTADDGTETLDRSKQYVLNATGGSKNSKLFINNEIRNADITLNNLTADLQSVSLLNFANGDGINSLNVNNAILNIGTMPLSSLHLQNFNNTGTINIASVDTDPANEIMGRITADNYGDMSGTMNVNALNVLSDPVKDKTYIPFADKAFSNNVKYFGQKEYYAPIYKYDVSYLPGSGEFLFARGGGSSGGVNSFNPAILASPVNTQAGAQATVTEAFKYVFEHADAFTQLPSFDRMAHIKANQYALSTDYNENLGTLATEFNNKAGWVRPYVTFEKMNLKNAPAVNATTYGTLVGFDSDFQKYRHGWTGLTTGYVGYNGSQLRYSGGDTTMNGGLLGLTQTFYKGNFWTALTLSAGASVGQTTTMYGKEDFTTLLAGVGSKTGYNFEFKEGRYIIQPIWFMSYTFANTFDYTNAAGVRIDSDPLHSIQLNPSVRFIMNTKNGWQPYASVGMVWNVMSETDISANGVHLPDSSIKPYAEYGLGVQKRFKDKYTAFGQAMVRNGGRNGIALTAGFRWALGRDGKKIDRQHEKVSLPAPKITLNGGKSAVGGNGASNQHPSSILPSTGKEGKLARHSEDFSPKNLTIRQKDSTLRSFANAQDDNKAPSIKGILRRVMTGEVQTVQGERKILKQMTASQKAAFNRKYNNTTITSKSAILKQL